MRHSFRALRHRNYRLFAIGQFFSLVGTWMQTVALGWLIYRLTRSPFLLGVSGFLSQVPSLFFSPIAGVLADRWNRHWMVIGTQCLAMVQALILAALVLSERATIPEILALNLLLGFINAADVPARQSFVSEMVRDPEDLPNAIALNSSLFNVARLVGPAIAGILIGFVSEGVVFLINGLSYAAVLLALVAIDVPRRPRQPGRAPNIWSHLAEGLHYAGHFAPIRAALLLLGAIGLLAMPYSVLLPMFAADVLHGGPHTFGFLVSSIGLGALSGALFLAGRRNVRGLGTVILWAVTALGVGLLILSQVRQEHLACVLLAITGFGVMVQIASTNTILQILVEPDKRGRVMSLYAVAFMGTMPLGSLVAGALAARIGAPTTMAISGFVALCAAGMFARALPRLRAEVLPIYRRLGIIAGPETGVLEPTPRANCSSTATTRNTAS